MNYRLKKEAVPYFKDELATRIYSGETWKSYHVDKKALEQVEDAYIEAGIKASTVDNFCGWRADTNLDRGSTFCFSIRFPSMKFEEYAKFSKGKIMRELMNRMQNEINTFYRGFNENAE
jgi:hypothetical protein